MLITVIYNGKEYAAQGHTLQRKNIIVSKNMVDGTWRYNSSLRQYEKTIDTTGLTVFRNDYWGVYDGQKVCVDSFKYDTKQCYVLVDDTSCYSDGFINNIVSDKCGRDIRNWTSTNKFDYFIEEKTIYLTSNIVSENKYTPGEMLKRYNSFG